MVGLLLTLPIISERIWGEAKFMDIFQTAKDIISIMDIFFFGRRATGRTTRLIQVVQPGDIVIFSNHEQKRTFEYHARDQNKKIGRGISDIRTMVCGAAPYFLAERLKGIEANNIYFDHVWMEKYYEATILDAEKTINGITNLVKKSSPSSSTKPIYPFSRFDDTSATS